MEFLFEQLINSVYPTQLSSGSIILTVFTLTMAVFFLHPAKKSSATLHLGLAYGYLAVFHLAYFIAFTFYHPLAAYHRWLTVPSILAAEIHLTGFILQYPDNKNMPISRIITVVMYSGVIITTAIFYSMLFGTEKIFKFDGHYYDFALMAAGKFSGRVVMVYSTPFLLAILLRLFQLQGDELKRMILIGIPCVAGATMPAVLNILNLNGYITREYFQVILNMCHLFSWLFMALLHLNTTEERFTFMGKIVGISIATFLAVFILNSFLTLLDMDRNYDSLKVTEARLHIVKPENDDGVLFLRSCSFPGGAAVSGGRSGHSVVLQPGCNEYFNTMVYEEIKRIPDQDFGPPFDSLLAGGGPQFAGYRNYLQDIINSIPWDSPGRGGLVAHRIDRMRGYINFHYNYLASVEDDKFREVAAKVISGTVDEFSPFQDAMLLFISGSALNGTDLKKEILKYIIPMNPSGSRKYIPGSHGRQYISYLYYDRDKRTVYEAGFSYLSYREYMQGSASRMIMIVLCVLVFMIAVYPFFFLGTMYQPLNTLLNGVKRVADGELDFRINVRIEDEIGEITRTFNTMTDRLRENRDEITRSAMRFRELADMLPDIIYETDVDLMITYMNRAGSNIAGYTREDISSGLTLSSLLSERDYRILRTFSEKCVDVEDAVFTRTHEIYKKDGGSFTGENKAVFIYNENGVSGLRGIIRDVTEKLKTEEALLQVQKMETIGTLVAGLAHDFNNILAGITGPLSIIAYSIEKKGSVDVDDFNVYLKTMSESSRRAVDLVQQLVNLSRKDTAALTPVDIADSIHQVVKICSSAFDKSIEIILKVPERPLMVMGDTTQVEQMLLNILINAGHAMTIMRPDGEKQGGKLAITADEIYSDEHFMLIHPEAKDMRYWRIAVSDTGIGMDSNTVSKIFIPFFTTKQRGIGTGLGLAMVYNIVKHHRGFIDVYSEKGNGSTFTIFLPVMTEYKEIKPAGITHAVPRGSGLILLADDEEAIRMTARMMLEKSGYDVITAVDGEDALRLYREHAGDIKAVVLDLLMPRMSGETAIIELRKINPDIKVILASGMIHDERVSRIASDDKCVFIQKPYTFDLFTKVVYNLINDIKE